MSDDYDYQAIRELLGRIDADKIAKLRADLQRDDRANREGSK